MAQARASPEAPAAEGDAHEPLDCAVTTRYRSALGTPCAHGGGQSGLASGLLVRPKGREGGCALLTCPLPLRSVGEMVAGPHMALERTSSGVVSGLLTWQGDTCGVGVVTSHGN